MERLSTTICITTLLATISTVLGCGVVPAGQGKARGFVAAGTRPFTVTGFTTLPVAMVYSTSPNIQARFPGIAPNEAAARGFVHRLIFDILERQGRSALLTDAVISAILDQLNVTINYTPMNCQMSVSPMDMHAQKTDPSCIIEGDTVTGICVIEKGNNKMCTTPEMGEVTITPINDAFLTIPGTLSTTNIIMANWSRMMWQSVLDRAVRMLALGPFGFPFSSARVTVGGN
ncbi:hypothetical protein KIN20_031051 [Parelaphostrongylus tenuis]|uniref:Uncharacterized protein n=1 Tax=Parelaphostrongylus tenuis TaxID=148309 RepID=A0AAD5R4M0_PARTN|nr:hypothetical protein KIN20_031051 [Parelaphostrongylus tenuis]